MMDDAQKLFDDVLAVGARRFEGDERPLMDALCRQIDVRKKLDAEASVVEALIGVLLANASDVGAEIEPGSCNDGWGLKCTNSVLKALDLRDDLPHSGEMRLAAMGVLDRLRRPEVTEQ